jgi:uncharacterized membrane protein
VSESATPFFDLFSVYFLAVEWIVFGSMHFFFRDATIAQIPAWIPAKAAITFLTGVLEVGTGILILVPAVRPWAALVSLCLLVLLLPAMIYILVSDKALIGPPAYKLMFRLILPPNNILLAICSYHLWIGLWKPA